VAQRPVERPAAEPLAGEPGGLGRIRRALTAQELALVELRFLGEERLQLAGERRTLGPEPGEPLLALGR
jgi:hypothetical protein